MITMFTTCKPFVGELPAIQRNAIGSWLQLQPQPEVVVYGTEAQGQILGRDILMVPLPAPPWNRPLVSEMFQMTNTLSPYDLKCYINADIVVMDGFMRAIKAAANRFDGTFLMIGQRWDAEVPGELDWDDPDWQANLSDYARVCGKLHPTSGMDYFVYRGDPWGGKILPFVVAAYMFDTWLLWRALQCRTPVIDATEAAIVVHQEHKSRVGRDCPEAAYNRKIVEDDLGGKDWHAVLRGTQHATWVMHSDYTITKK